MEARADSSHIQSKKEVQNRCIRHRTHNSLGMAVFVSHRTDETLYTGGLPHYTWSASMLSAVSPPCLLSNTC